MTDVSLASALDLVRRSGYRVLAPFQKPSVPAWPNGRPDFQDSPPLHVGVYLDTETTGLDPVRDEVIQLGMVRFLFTSAGQIVAYEQAYEGLREPTHRTISEEAIAIHGITPDRVKGQTLQLGLVGRVLQDAALVVSHHADFDRRMVEKLWNGEVFNGTQAWGCSHRDVDWKAKGYECAKLGHLLQDVRSMTHGEDRHSALADVYAGLSILDGTQPTPPEITGRWHLTELLESVRRPTIRIFATGSRFEKKDELKAHGYQWDGERRRAWYYDASPSTMDDELAWLYKTDTAVKPDLKKLTARERYSVRAD